MWIKIREFEGGCVEAEPLILIPERMLHFGKQMLYTLCEFNQTIQK